MTRPNYMSFFFLEKSFCSFIKIQIYKHLSNPQHGDESCDLEPTISKVPTLSVHIVCNYTVTVVLSSIRCGKKFVAFF